MTNIAVIQGRLTATPELRHTQTDIPVTTFTLANDTGFGDKKKTSFLEIVAWRGTAEFAAKYLTKGMMVVVDGQIQARSYEDRDGNKRKAVEIVANNISFCESKKKEDSDVTSRGPEGFAPVDDDIDLPF